MGLFRVILGAVLETFLEISHKSVFQNAILNPKIRIKIPLRRYKMHTNLVQHPSSGRIQCVPTGGCHDVTALRHPSKIHYPLPSHPPPTHRSLLIAHSSLLITPPPSPQTKNPPPHRKWIFFSQQYYNIIYCVPSLCFSPAAS